MPPLGIFSIGLPLLVAAGLAVWGTVRDEAIRTGLGWRHAGVGLAAAALPFAVLILFHGV